MLATERTVPVLDMCGAFPCGPGSRGGRAYARSSGERCIPGCRSGSGWGRSWRRRAERGEGKRCATEGKLRTKERRVWVCMPIPAFYAKRESLFCRKEEESKDCRLAVSGRSTAKRVWARQSVKDRRIGGFEGEAELGGFVRWNAAWRIF